MDKNYSNAKSLGERLYILREKKGLSQEELAEILNVSRQTISNWENDKVKLDVVKATEICRLYKISLDELLTDTVCVREPKSRQRNKAKLVVLLIALILSVALIITAIVLLISRDNSTVSSAILISEAAGWGIAIFLGVIAVIVAIFLIFKIKKDK